MKHWILPVLANLIVCTAFSQSNFSTGYIVKNNGDTIRGYLKLDPQEALADRVKFRKETTGEPTIYTVSEVGSFRFDEGPYYRAIRFVNIAKDSAETETRFGRVLAIGTYTLYKVPKGGVSYYVVKSDTSTWFLFETKFLVGDVTPGNYQNVLDFISVPCEKINREAVRVTFSDQSISNFVDRVNRCVEPAAQNKILYQRPKAVTHWVVYGGGLPNGDRYQVTAEAALRITYPSLDAHASFNIGAHYSNTGDVFSWLEYGTIEKHQATYQRVLSIPLTIQYNFASGRFQPYIYAGFSAALLQQGPAPVLDETNRFGAAVIGGIGIDAYLVGGLAIRADWRYELLMQHPSVGIAYKF
jgi:hypothetical protein